MAHSNKYIREENYKQFQAAMATLNEAQQKAVKHTEGPVMVVAGPGTGKTQLLAARVGYILETAADISPRNILCLTFTDAGAIAMRRRLLQFIGPEAYNVNIYTFHSFCNKIIRENLSEFGGFRNLQTLSDLEAVEVLHEIIDEFPNDHYLKRFKGKIYFDRRGMQGLFETMKKENWTPEIIKEAFENYKVTVQDDEAYTYKRKTTDKKTGAIYQKGDVNPGKVDKELNKFKTTLAAIEEFEKYKLKLEQRERFDYADMILWVIQEWATNENLLMDYQEQYQYILVDEYQDTNGSQNEIVNQLVSYWGDQANIFVVGDDDQSIFRFQGANMGNITKFKQDYNPEVIILENNYRSSQAILDRSKQLIEENKERLVHMYPEYTKNLIESRSGQYPSVKPSVIEYFNEVHESKDIADQIIALARQGVKLSEIAVIYKKHKNAEDLVKYLSHKGIALNLKRKIDVLYDPEIDRLITILRYIHAELNDIHSAEGYLFKMLHYSFFNLKPYDIGKLAIYCSRRTESKEDDYKWRTVLQNKDDLKKAGVKHIDDVIRVGATIEQWIADIHNMTLQTLFERILTQSGIFTDIMQSGNSAWRFQLINTFFDLIKNESAKNPKFSLDDLLAVIENMFEAEVPLPLMKITHSESGVNFITAHSSKGLEFEHVFIIQADQKNWIKANYKNNRFKFPPPLVPVSDNSDVEDDRRLFYVAMTRCKTHLQISYSNKSKDDSELEPCSFIPELLSGSDIETQKINLTEEQVTEYSLTLMKQTISKPILIDHEHIDRVLQDYSVSVTHLNKYLRCPLSFYFENILRVPMARSSSMGFGSAIHYAFENFFSTLEADPQRKTPVKSVLIDLFEKGMYKHRSHFTERQYDDLKIYGTELLTNYYDHYESSWSVVREFKPEHSVKLSEYKGIPINGKIDSIAYYDDKMEVIDFKTGKYNYAAIKLKAPNEENENGGDYWRQIVFYKLLLDQDPVITKPMTSGTMDFIEPHNSKLVRKTIEVSPEDVAIVEQQLIESYDKIKKHEFETGCGEDDCQWCQFVNHQFEINPKLDNYIDEEDLAEPFTGVAEQLSQVQD